MNTVFLGARVVHILCAALWIGTVVFTSLFLMPVMQAAGPEGGKLMVGLNRRGFPAFISSIAGLTVLTGFYLYWHLTAGFDPAQSATTSAKVFGAGGVLGLAALIIGASIVGRSAGKATELVEKMPSMSDKDRAAAVAEMGRLRQRMVTFGSVVIGLLVVTIVLMSIGHYV